MESKVKPLISKLCAFCGEEFKTHYKKQLYCKKACTKKANYKNYPDYDRDYCLQNTYGISLKQYQLLLEEQGNVCKMCAKPEMAILPRTGLPRNLSVDHCHTTGKIRGLLCVKCNSIIGYAKDNTKLLEIAIQYLRGE